MLYGGLDACGGPVQRRFRRPGHRHVRAVRGTRGPARCGPSARGRRPPGWLRGHGRRPRGGRASPAPTITEGDAVLIGTGWSRLWNDGPPSSGSAAGCPGPGEAAADWLAATQDPAHGRRDHRLRADRPRGRPRDAPRPPSPARRCGINIVETMRLSELMDAQAGAFLFVLAPAATGRSNRIARAAARPAERLIDDDPRATSAQRSNSSPTLPSSCRDERTPGGRTR